MISSDRIFDFWGIFANDIIGDPWLATFLFPLVIIFLAVKLKMPWELQLMFLVLMLIAIFTKTLTIIIWVFVVLVVGAISYFNYAKALQ